MAAYSITELVNTDIETSIPTMALYTILSNPPFYTVPGIFNLREIIPGYAYRSGTLKNVTEDGNAKLSSELGVVKVFDLRTTLERNASAAPNLVNIETVWTPSEDEVGNAKPIPAEFFKDEAQVAIPNPHYCMLMLILVTGLCEYVH